MSATIQVTDLIKVLCNDWKPSDVIAVEDLELIIADNGGRK